MAIGSDWLFTLIISQARAGRRGDVQEKMVSKLHGRSCYRPVHKGWWIATPREFRKEEEAVWVFPVPDAGRRGQTEGPAGQTVQRTQ